MMNIKQQLHLQQMNRYQDTIKMPLNHYSSHEKNGQKAFKRITPTTMTPNVTPTNSSTRKLFTNIFNGSTNFSSIRIEYPKKCMFNSNFDLPLIIIFFYSFSILISRRIRHPHQTTSRLNS